MKLIATAALTGGLMMTPVAQAAGNDPGLQTILEKGTSFGITHFVEIERDSEDGGSEIKGWIDPEWIVELDIEPGGAITKEERRKRIDGPWGMTADEAGGYVDSALSEGMVRVKEIDIDTSGFVEVEGRDADGRELEVEFRAGSTKPVSVERDD